MSHNWIRNFLLSVAPPLFSVLAIVAPATAQEVTGPLDATTPPGLAPGTPAGSYALSGFDNVSLYNGRLNFALPLLKIKGRGEAGYNLTLQIQTIWHVGKSLICDSSNNCFVADYATEGDWTIPVGYGPGRFEGRTFAPSSGSCSDGSQRMADWTLDRFTFKAPDGTEHELRDQVSDGRPISPVPNCGASSSFNRGTIFIGKDESGLKFVADTPLIEGSLPGSTTFGFAGNLFFRDGSVYRINDQGEVTVIRDRNGNQISFQYDSSQRVAAITDSLNRSINISYFDVNGLGYDDITFPGASGVIRHVKVFHDNMDQALRTGFTIQDVTTLFSGFPDQLPATVDPKVVTSVQLPNGQSYQFKYNSDAELARVVLPTGGAIEYDYAKETSTAIDDTRTYRRVVARRTYSDGVTQEGAEAFSASYTAAPPPPATVGQTTTVTVTHQDGNNATLSSDTHSFLGIPSFSVSDDLPYPSWNEGKEYQSTIGGLQAISNTFQQGGVAWYPSQPSSQCPGSTCSNYVPPADAHLTQSDTTIHDTGQLSRRTMGYDNFSNVTDTTESDFGAGAPGPLLRETHTAFVTDSNYTSGSVYLPSLPSAVSTYLGPISNPTLYALTQYEYDCYQTNDCSNSSDTLHAPLTLRSGIVQMDASYANGSPAPARYRGNPTKITQGVFNDASSYFEYDVAGSVVAAIDANQNKTTIAYDPSSNNGNTYGFRTAITNALSHTTQIGWDLNIGKPLSITDPNSNVTQATYNDLLDRLKHVTRPDSSTTTYQYNDPANTVTTISDVTLASATTLCTPNVQKTDDLVFDGLGRKWQEIHHDPIGNVVFKTTYDAMGRVFQVFNPVVGGPTTSTPKTTTTYDALSRPLQIMEADGQSTTGFSYFGNQVTRTDPNNHSTVSFHDALGRLYGVTDAAGNGTGYTYDPLDNLLTVTNLTQTRSFAYDSLKRLVCASNPESRVGATSCRTSPLPTSGLDRYSYDANGNVLTKTNASGIVTSLNSYDALNRPHSKTYNDGVTSEVDYIYDTHFRGTLSSVSNGVSTTSYDVYDSMGRVTQSTQTTQGQNPFVFHYTYNSAGALELLTYPSQRQVTTCYDQSARPQQVRNGTASNAPTYASGVQYTPHGALANMTLGGGLLSEQWQYSPDRLQPTSLTVPGLSLSYFYCPLGASACTTNNGNLQRQTIGTPLLNLTQDYTYDALDRLLTAKENNGANWSQTYSYDAVGNRAVSGYIQRPAWTPTSVSQYAANNQWRRGTGDQYDNAGNQTALGSDTAPNVVSSTFGYDAENRLVSANIGSTGGVSYQYDGDGRRVKKTVGTTVTTYVYDTSGQLAAEYSNQSAAVGTMYLTADHLGSTRLVTKSSGGVLRYDYLPFGEDLPQGIGGRGTEYPAASSVTFPAGADVLSQKFTSKERDAETGLDYFGARYLSSAQGRWAIPDWSEKPQPVPHAKLENPQSLNLYGYVLNNPLSHIDPDGHIDCSGKNAEGAGCQAIATWNAARGISPAANKSDFPGVPVKLPNGTYVPDPHSPTGRMMAPVADLRPVAAAGKELKKLIPQLIISGGGDPSGAFGYMIGVLEAGLAHGGEFDYQRVKRPTGGYQQLPQFRDVSNFNVGLFAQQAGMSLDETLTIAGTFARLFSSNYRPNSPYGLDPQTAEFTRLGYEAGARIF